MHTAVLFLFTPALADVGAATPTLFRLGVCMECTVRTGRLIVSRSANFVSPATIWAGYCITLHCSSELYQAYP